MYLMSIADLSGQVDVLFTTLICTIVGMVVGWLITYHRLSSNSDEDKKRSERLDDHSKNISENGENIITNTEFIKANADHIKAVEDSVDGDAIKRIIQYEKESLEKLKKIRQHEKDIVAIEEEMRQRLESLRQDAIMKQIDECKASLDKSNQLMIHLSDEVEENEDSIIRNQNRINSNSSEIYNLKEDQDNLEDDIEELERKASNNYWTDSRQDDDIDKLREKINKQNPGQ